MIIGLIFHIVFTTLALLRLTQELRRAQIAIAALAKALQLQIVAREEQKWTQ